MKKLLCGLLAAFLVLAVSGDEAKGYRHEATGLELPAELGGFKFARVTTYPQPELGISVAYKKDAFTATILKIKN